MLLSHRRVQNPSLQLKERRASKPYKRIKLTSSLLNQARKTTICLSLIPQNRANLNIHLEKTKLSRFPNLGKRARKKKKPVDKAEKLASDISADGRDEARKRKRRRGMERTEFIPTMNLGILIRRIVCLKSRY